MPEITSLLPQPGKKNQVAVYLDGAYAFALRSEIVLEQRLSIGKQLSEMDVANLQASEEFQDTLNLAYRFLSYKPRTEAEVRTRLRKAGAGLSLTDAVINRLKQQRFLDDANLAANVAEHRTSTSPRSAKMIGWELRRRGVAAEVVEEATEPLDDEQTAYQAAAKRSARMSEVEYADFRRKLGGFLQRRGFSYGVSARAVERVWRERTGADTDD